MDEFKRIHRPQSPSIARSLIFAEFDFNGLRCTGENIMLSCPDCHEEFEHKGRYDEDMDESVQCPGCGYTASKWCFDYIPGEEEDEQSED